MISVIIPIYNVENYLEECLRSIQGNDGIQLEIICVNDGSTDRSLQILQTVAEEDSRIVIIDQKNQGVQQARNAGLIAAKGEYIAFIDSDDRVHPQYFSNLLGCMEENAADAAICGCQLVYDDERTEYDHFETISFDRLTGVQFYKDYYSRHMCWGRLYRRSIIEGVWFEREVKVGEDTLFNLCAVSSLNTPKVYKTDVPLYYYRQREGSLVRSIRTTDYMGIPDWVHNYFHENKQNAWSWMPLMQATKMGLSCRYEARLSKYNELYQHAQEVLRQLIKRIMTDGRITFRDKVIHWVFIYVPWIYRQFRIKDDPSLKKWEKIVKERLKEEKAVIKENRRS